MWAVGFIWGDFTTYYANVGLGASRMPFIMVAFGGDAYSSENNVGVACQCAHSVSQWWRELAVVIVLSVHMSTSLMNCNADCHLRLGGLA